MPISANHIITDYDYYLFSPNSFYDNYNNDQHKTTKVHTFHTIAFLVIILVILPFPAQNDVSVNVLPLVVHLHDVSHLRVFLFLCFPFVNMIIRQEKKERELISLKASGRTVRRKWRWSRQVRPHVHLFHWSFCLSRPTQVEKSFSLSLCCCCSPASLVLFLQILMESWVLDEGTHFTPLLILENGCLESLLELVLFPLNLINLSVSPSQCHCFCTILVILFFISSMLGFSRERFSTLLKDLYRVDTRNCVFLFLLSSSLSPQY